MISKVVDYITKYDIIKAHDHIIAGVSGGADSVCLFCVLLELQKSIDFCFEVVHIEHGIRGEASLYDADFTRSLCEKSGILCTVINVDVPTYALEHGLGHEEAARLLRYEAFVQRAMETDGKIALAHHLEDNAETILFQMVRGSGLHGLSGMNPVRIDNGIKYIRPLLCVSREEIETYLEKLGQKYCTDETNSDVNYDRNRIRHRILPELNKINDKAMSHINMTANKLSVIEDYLNQQVKSAVDDILSIKDEKYIVDIKKLNNLHPAIKSECVLEIIGMAAGRKKDIADVHINQLIELSGMQSGKMINLPYSLLASREYNNIIIAKQDTDNVTKFHFEVIADQIKKNFIELEKGQESLEIDVFDFDGDFDKIPQKAYTKWVDYDKIKDGFCIRKRREGDFFINDSMGHRKKLKSFFTDEKIPVSKRDDIWLMAKGQEIIVVFGYRISEAYKVTSDTKKIVEVTYNGRK